MKKFIAKFITFPIMKLLIKIMDWIEEKIK
jgi:hypothetical protein